MQGATGRVIVGLLWLIILVAVAGAWSAGARTAKAATPRPAAAPVKPVVHEGAAAPRVDLYGNHIEEAVSDYRVDPYGDVYERHSPDTAVGELTAPSL
jgi:hypothetical protein